MKAIEKILTAGFILIIVLFGVCAFTLVGFAGVELWTALDPNTGRPVSKRINSVLKCIAMLTIAMASLELSATIIEDEFKSEARMSAPVRTRRVLLRFLVVVIVSLAIECLVATFQYLHDDPAMLMQAAFIAFAAAALLVSWDAFLRLSRSSSD